MKILLDRRSAPDPTVYQQQLFGVTKVTIRPEFFGTVPNFEGLSRKKYKVIQDAELSRISNPVPNLSRFNVKRQTVDQNAVHH